MTIDQDAWGTERPQGEGWDIGAHEVSDGSTPPPANEPETFYYCPDLQTTGNDPVVDDDDFSVRNISVDSIDYSEIVETETPIGTKAWRLKDAESGNRFFNFSEVPSDANDLNILCLWRLSASSVNYAHILPGLRLNASGDVTGYVGGVINDTGTRCRRWFENSQTAIGDGSVLHGISPISEVWLYTEIDLVYQTLRLRTWEQGTTKPDWQISLIGNTEYTSGGAGFQLWLNGVDETDPIIDIAWYSVGIEGASAPSPEEISTPVGKHFYYSVSPYGTGDIFSGEAYISISGGIGTFSQPQAINIGQGCRVTYDTDKVCYINHVYSDTQFGVQDAGGDHPPNGVYLGVVSIAHEYASFSAAEAGASDANHMDTVDLETADYYLHLVGYCDHDDGTKDTTPVTVDGYTTGDADRIFFESANGGTKSLYNNRQPGYVPASPEHYQLYITSASNVIEVLDPGVVIDGLEIVLDNATTGLKCVHFNNVAKGSVKNSLIWASSEISNQDGIRAFINTTLTGIVNIENTIIHGFYRGINAITLATANANITANINSSTVYNCDEGIKGHQYLGPVAINVLNSISIENDTDFVVGAGVPVWNIHNSLDSDGTIASRDASAYGCLSSRTATDSLSPGVGDWVIFENITTGVDLRLQESAGNDAMDMHSDDSGAGMTIPAVDIVGTSRPDRAGYDCGAFEVQAQSVWMVIENGSGDFTSVLGALSSDRVYHNNYIAISGTWENDDLVSDTAAFQKNNITLVALGDARYPGYPVENPTHWRARKTTEIESAVFDIGECTGIILDGLDIAHDGGADGVVTRCISVDPANAGALTIKNSVLHRTVTTVGEEAIGVDADGMADGFTINFETTQLCGLSDAGIVLVPDVDATCTLNTNCCSIVENGDGLRFDGADIVFNCFNSTIAGNTTDINDLGADSITADIHNSIDSDGTLADTDPAAFECETATAVTDSGEPGEGDLVFRNITTLPYDLRLREHINNIAYNMHGSTSGAGLALPDTDISGQTRLQHGFVDCGSYEIDAQTKKIFNILTYFFGKSIKYIFGKPLID